jgi:ribonuclease VapC
MVVDSSALLAILQDEPERRAMIETLESADRRCLSVVNLVEASVVIETRRGPAAARLLDTLVERAGIEVVGVDLEQGELARRAFARYGKGRHAAGLNFGDCFAYALARAFGESLLFKGNDFSQTDVVPALPPPGPSR